MRWIVLSLQLLTLVLVAGCTGLNTFGTAARAGDTVVMTLGWNLGLSRTSINYITITDAAGSSVVLAADDALIRSIFNAYPDPMSRLLVQAEAGEGTIMSMLIEGAATAGDKEYSETMLMLDLPAGLMPGQASVSITMLNGDVLGPVGVEVLPGTGEAASFENQQYLSINATHLRALERAPHYTIGFSGEVVPFGIQVDLSHDPDSSLGGVGLPYVVNPRGDIKNVSWSDDGVNLRVILLPVRDGALSNIKSFKFYVSGAVTGLQIVSVRAFDENGIPIAGVAADIL